MRFRDFGFRAKLYTLVGVFAANFLLFAACSSWMRSEVQVEGPLYKKIKGMQDLRADILPPPLSLLEPALLLNEIAKDPSADRRSACRERFEACRKEFEARQQFWTPDALGGDVQPKLYSDVIEPADRFFKLAERSLGSLLQSDSPGDDDPMRRSDAFDLEWPKLQLLYIANQNAINQLSVETERLARVNEKAATDSVRWWSGFMFILGAGNLALVLALSSWIANSIVGPTRMLIGRMREMSQGAGDLTARIPVDSQDEIGELAQSINAVVQRLHDLVS
ncbi:MAG: HAMP domain-containing protein, partial [Planctomycetota bacterium]